MSFMSITGRDLNRDMQVLTPSKKRSLPIGRVDHRQRSVDLMEELTLQGEDRDKDEALSMMPHSQFDKIAENVNQTIRELCLIYHQIGYSATETATKKSEIFTIIQDTISNFTHNLNREKSNIENECEWLRQQIRIILAMMGDNNGERSLSTLSRGIVFDDAAMYESGVRESRARVNHGALFHACSPFNVSKDDSLEYTLDDATVNHVCQEEATAPLTLLDTKKQLNTIFLQLLTKFTEIFKMFVESLLARADILDVIGADSRSSSVSKVWLESLPTREECEESQHLIGRFETIMHQLSHSPQQHVDDAYIISSPRKEQKAEEPVLSPMRELREVDYKLVRMIRGLRITKITQELFVTLQAEIDYCQGELESRMRAMHDTIARALELIELLALNENQLASLQRRYESEDAHTAPTASCNSTLGSCLLDRDTLRFIQSNPREFGLSSTHLGYIDGFCQVLHRLKESKQRKWDQYYGSCLTLWGKLGESPEYIEKFLALNGLLSDESLSNFKHELNRLLVKRSQYIETFIAEAKRDIEAMWDRLLYSHEQRQHFCAQHVTDSPSLDSTTKETILNKHDAELKRLQLEYHEKQAILDLYAELQSMLEDQEFLRESSRDLSRLLSKNSCKILLNEEKIRKRIHRGIPNTLKQLKAEVVAYNNALVSQNQKPFTVFGEDLFEKLIIVESQQHTKRPALRQGSQGQSSGRVFKRPLDRSPTHSAGASRGRSPAPRRPPRGGTETLDDRSPTQAVGVKRAPAAAQDKPSMRALKPLNVPLTEANVRHLSDSSSLASSRLSPLKTSFSSRLSMSPARDDKENSFCTKYSLSPIKVCEYVNGAADKVLVTDNTLESSTIIGEDYQTWRSERIKQLNMD
jgi:protein regulator of cytokinesis 1